MKTFAIIAIIAISLIGGAVALSSNGGDQPKQVAGTSTTQSGIQEIQKAVSNGAQFIDVRTAAEYAAGHVDGATNLSLQEIQAGQLPQVDKQQTIYVYCHSGNRSGQATTLLKKAGYTNIIDLGGIAHVQEIGGRIVTGS